MAASGSTDMGVMSAIEGGSVPPPGWDRADTSQVGALPPATLSALVPEPLTIAAQPPAEAAVRWRLSAAGIDNLLVYAIYLLICLLLHWRVADLSHILVLLALGVVYHLALESRDGQTVGKRRYGIRVVSLDGQTASPKAIAIRSILRLIDSLPFWYLSGLVSMVRTGPARRQRIGDVAAETKVIAVGGRAASRGTPGWMLPTATLAALAVSALVVYGIAEAGHQPLSGVQETEFVTGCENSTRGTVDCQCFLNRLEADGYNTVDSLNTLMQDAETERLNGQQGTARNEVIADAAACR